MPTEEGHRDEIKIKGGVQKPCTKNKSHSCLWKNFKSNLNIEDLSKYTVSHSIQASTPNWEQAKLFLVILL